MQRLPRKAQGGTASPLPSLLGATQKRLLCLPHATLEGAFESRKPWGGSLGLLPPTPYSLGAEKSQGRSFSLQEDGAAATKPFPGSEKQLEASVKWAGGATTRISL